MKRLIPWGKAVAPAFLQEVQAIRDYFGWYREADGDLLTCFAFETAETFRPDIRNLAGSGAVGSGLMAGFGVGILVVFLCDAFASPGKKTRQDRPSRHRVAAPAGGAAACFLRVSMATVSLVRTTRLNPVFRSMTILGPVTTCRPFCIRTLPPIVMVFAATLKSALSPCTSWPLSDVMMTPLAALTWVTRASCAGLVAAPSGFFCLTADVPGRRLPPPRYDAVRLAA